MLHETLLAEEDDSVLREVFVQTEGQVVERRAGGPPLVAFLHPRTGGGVTLSPQHFLLVVNCRSCGRELPAGIVSRGARLEDTECRAICATCARSWLVLARDLRRVPIEKPN